MRPIMLGWRYQLCTNCNGGARIEKDRVVADLMLRLSLNLQMRVSQYTSLLASFNRPHL